MNLQLTPLRKEHTAQFKRDMQAAFQEGAEAVMPADGSTALPEKDIDRSLANANAIAYEAVADGEMVGGAIVVIDKAARRGHLDFLYVKSGCQGRRIGQSIWKAIEAMHPDMAVWETCTPYFDRRNIHFYINRCGFSAVEFFWHLHPDPNDPHDSPLPDFDGMFRFEKVMRKD